MTVQQVWNRHYGHFNPNQKVQSATPSTVQKFNGILDKTLNSEKDFQTVVDSMAEILPSFIKVYQALNKGEIFLKPLSIPTFLSPENAAGGYILGFPLRNSIRETSLPLFLRACATIVALPDGLQIPTFFYCNSKSKLKKIIEERFLWRTALQQSFLYQFELETRRAGITIINNLGVNSAIENIDWAVFEYFIKDGLQGIVNAYPNFISKVLRDSLHENSKAVIEKIIRGAMAVHGNAFWKKPPLSEKPEWISTELDKVFKFYSQHNKGLYTKDPVDKKLDEKELRRIKDDWNSIVTTNADIDRAKDLIHSLAPNLATWLFGIISAKKISIEFSDHFLIQPAVINGPRALLSGDLNEEGTILISSQYKLGEVAAHIVTALGKFSVPLDLTEFYALNDHDVARGDINRVQKTLEEIFIINDVWGISARAEFFYQARKRGFKVEDPEPGFLEGTDLLDKAGFWALCHNYNDFLNQEAAALIREQYSELAMEIVRSSKRNG